MKKRSISFYCSILLGFCQVLMVSGGVFAIEQGVPEEKLQIISAHCDEIRENLRRVQREDSIVRTHIGPYYNTVLTKFMKPLNLRLVENNLTEQRLFDNQSNFATAQESFRSNYSDYQRALEELAVMDCVNEPGKFYTKLTTVREKRKIVAGDASKMRKLVTDQMTIVKELKAKL